MDFFFKDDHVSKVKDKELETDITDKYSENIFEFFLHKQSSLNNPACGNNAGNHLKLSKNLT